MSIFNKLFISKMLELSFSSFSKFSSRLSALKYEPLRIYFLSFLKSEREFFCPSLSILLAFFLYKRSISQLKFAEKKAKDQNLIPVTLKEKVFKEQSI